MDDRLELGGGPDYRKRYDYFIFKESHSTAFFAEIPADQGLSLKDMRALLRNRGCQPNNHLAPASGHLTLGFILWKVIKELYQEFFTVANP